MRQLALDASRRDVIRTIGAGALFSGIGGTVAAQTDEDDQSADGDGGAVHEVQTLISGPPTNPERPADFFYQPTGIHVEPGDVVRFVFTTPDHNVVSYHPAFGMRRRVPTGAQAFSSPLLGWRPDSIAGDQIDPPGEGDSDSPVPDTWLQSFDTPGVYDILCSPHEVFGMVMRVVVGDETDTEFETEDPSALPEPRAGPVGLARATLTDPALQPDNIVENETVAWESVGGPSETTDTPEQ